MALCCIPEKLAGFRYKILLALTVKFHPSPALETVILYVVISEEPFTAGAWHCVAHSNKQVTLLSKEHFAVFKAFKVIIATVDVQDRCAEEFCSLFV